MCSGLWELIVLSSACQHISLMLCLPHCMISFSSLLCPSTWAPCRYIPDLCWLRQVGSTGREQMMREPYLKVWFPLPATVLLIMTIVTSLQTTAPGRLPRSCAHLVLVMLSFLVSSVRGWKASCCYWPPGSLSSFIYSLILTFRKFLY